jgi:hypothetical protein
MHPPEQVRRGSVTRRQIENEGLQRRMGSDPTRKALAVAQYGNLVNIWLMIGVSTVSRATQLHGPGDAAPFRRKPPFADWFWSKIELIAANGDDCST